MAKYKQKNTLKWQRPNTKPSVNGIFKELQFIFSQSV